MEIQTELLETNPNLTNYYLFRGYFKNDIDEIIKLGESFQKQDGNVSSEINKSYRDSQISWIPPNENSLWLYQKINKLIKTANHEMWNFHLTTWKDHLQYTTYQNGGFYDWHMDFGGNSSTRKLSFVIQLSDPNDYQGGNLEFLLNRSIIQAPKEQGTIIFFPSYLTHRVTEVSEGTRRTLVSWVHGPCFK